MIEKLFNHLLIWNVDKRMLISLNYLSLVENILFVKCSQMKRSLQSRSVSLQSVCQESSFKIIIRCKTWSVPYTFFHLAWQCKQETFAQPY